MNATAAERFLSAASWLAIVIGGLAVPIAFFTFATAISGGDGTRNADPLDLLVTILAPPAALIAGLGLRARARWAWTLMFVLLALLCVHDVLDSLEPVPQPGTTIRADGVKVTVLGTGERPLPWFGAICAMLLAGLVTPAVRSAVGIAVPSARTVSASSSAGTPTPDSDESTDRARGWRVGHRGRDQMYYEEWRDGTWWRIEIDGEMLMGPAHHAIYFAPPSVWRSYPPWARDRRDEIVARVCSVFTPPDYTYHDVGYVSHAGALPVTHDPKTLRALRIAILACALVGVGAAGFAVHGVAVGETRLIGPRGGGGHYVTREASPVSFWASIAVLGAISAAGFGAAAWLAIKGRA